MGITTAEKEWLKRLGTNKPVKNDKLQTEEKARNKEIRSDTTKARNEDSWHGQNIVAKYKKRIC